MKKLTACRPRWLLALAALPRPPTIPGSATTADIQGVQDELYNLEEAVRTSPPRIRATTSSRTATEEIRENVTYLRVQIRRHQRDGGGEGTGRLRRGRELGAPRRSARCTTTS